VAEPVDPAERSTRTDNNITANRREVFFGFNELYKPYTFPTFSEGEQPTPADVASYVYYLQERDTVVDYIPGDQVEKAAQETFGLSFGLTKEDKVAVSWDYNRAGRMLARLGAYSEEPQGDLKKVSVKLMYYSVFPFGWEDYIEQTDYDWFTHTTPLTEQIHALEQQEGITYYQAARRLFASDAVLQGEPEYVVHLTYLTKDGLKPEKYLSCVKAEKTGQEWVYSDSAPTAEEPYEPVISTATKEQRAFFYDFCKKYDVYAMRDFAPGEQPDLEAFKWYALSWLRDEAFYEEGINGSVLYGESVERAAALFGWTYGLQPQEKVRFKSDGGNEEPVYILRDYKEEPQGGQTLVTVTVDGYSAYTEGRLEDYEFEYIIGREYSATTLAVYQEMQKQNCTYLQALRSLAIENGTLPAKPLYTFRFSYLTADGKTPTQFVSFTRE
jgi:hypothetical protein